MVREPVSCVADRIDYSGSPSLSMGLEGEEYVFERQAVSEVGTGCGLRWSKQRQATGSKLRCLRVVWRQSGLTYAYVTDLRSLIGP